MASISISNIGSTSFSFKLTGLQTKGSDGKDLTYVRRCQWSVRDKNNSTLWNPDETINPGKTEGISHTITDLSSNATYTVTCLVYRINDNGGETYLDGFSTEVTTSSSGGSGGGDETQTWTIYNQGSKTSFSGDMSTQMVFDQYRICKYEISFAYSGTATFYTSNSAIDTYVYLTDASNDGYIKVNGKPPDSDILAESDESTITYRVIAGMTYYVWVRDYYGTNTGPAMLNIVSPKLKSWSDYNEGTITTDNGLDSFSLFSNRLHRWSVLPDADGVLYVGIAANSSCDNLCLYVTTSMGYGKTTGIPDGVIAEIESNKSSFVIQCDVEADTTYYIWVREADGNSTGSMALVVTLSVPTIDRWSWEFSNGTASDDETYESLMAVLNYQRTLNFSRKVWNDMVDKTKKIIDNSTKLWDKTYADTADGTKMHTSPCDLTAVMFNSLRNNLELAGTGAKIGLEKIPNAPDPDNAYQGTIPHPVSSGDPVYGHYFITLTNYMNDCIDKINGL